LCGADSAYRRNDGRKTLCRELRSRDRLTCRETESGLRDSEVVQHRLRAPPNVRTGNSVPHVRRRRSAGFEQRLKSPQLFLDLRKAPVDFRVKMEACTPEGTLDPTNRILRFCKAYIHASGKLLEGSVGCKAFRPMKRFLGSREPLGNARPEFLQPAVLSDYLVHASQNVLGPRESRNDLRAQSDGVFERLLECLLGATEPPLDIDAQLVECLKAQRRLQIAHLVDR